MGSNALLRIVRFFIALITLIIAVLTICAYIGSKHGGAFQIFAFYGLFQPLLILSNFVLLVYWSVRLKGWAIVPLIAIILNIGYIGAVYQIPWKKNKAEVSAQQHFKLATYNVKGFYHGLRPLTVSMISDFMKEKEVNVICFQEVDYDSTFTIDSIAKAFSYLPYRSVAISEREGFSLMVLSKFPISHSIRIRFGNEGNQAMLTDLAINGDTIRLFNFHLQTTNFNQTRFPIVPQNWLWDLSGETEKSMSVYDVLINNFRKRTQQAAFLHQEMLRSPHPILACGDMNSNPSSYTYHQIKGNLHDGFKTCGSGYEYTLEGLRKLFRIDYIFHSREFRGYNYTSYPLDYSDHRPVIMELSLGKSKKEKALPYEFPGK